MRWGVILEIQSGITVVWQKDEVSPAREARAIGEQFKGIANNLAEGDVPTVVVLEAEKKDIKPTQQDAGPRVKTPCYAGLPAGSQKYYRVQSFPKIPIKCHGVS